MTRTLMVASAGGHLTQLVLLLPRLRPFIQRPLWVTYDVPQARSLLAEADVIDGHHPTTRNLLNAVRNYKLAVDVFDEHDISRVISTGAGLAVPFMIRAWRLGIPCHYIETATRVTGPSLTGRILEMVPGVNLYTQYPHWVRPGWLYVGSVYDGFRVSYGSAEPVHRIFVSVGSQDYPFDTLVDSMEELLREEDEVVWQLGATVPGRALPGTVHTSFPADEQDRLLRESDVVVGHCGTGLALSSLHQGRIPVLVPRRQRRGEHVDDHQVITAKELRERDLAVVREVELLDRSDLERAAGGEAQRSTAQPFRLVEGEQVPEGAEPLTTPAQWRRRLGLRLALVDAVTIGASSLLAYLARNALGQAGVVGEFANEIPVALTVLPLWLLLFYWFGAYRPEYLNSSGDAFRRFTAGVTGGVLALGFVSFVFQLRLSRLYVLFLFLLVFTLGGLARLGLRRHLGRRYERGELTQNVLIVGADDEAAEVARAMRATRSGYEVVGFVDDGLDEGSSVDGVPVVGAVRAVLDKAYQLRAGLVVVSPGGVEPGTLQDILVELEGTPIDLAVAPSLFEVVTRRVTIESIANVPILHVDQIRLERGKAFVKRGLDLVAATLLGLLTLPVTALAAVAVRIGSDGPILFRQQRLGRDGRPFTIYKFRTMVEDAEERLQEVEHLNEVGHGFFKIRGDPRVTRVGRTLRKWSIDELPQLWNVLSGDMSMVGPRPPLPEEVEEYEPWQLRRLRVRPGITGIWQVSGRSHVPFEEAVRMDLFYIENWSLGFDLYLLAKTFPAVLGRSGAY